MLTNGVTFCNFVFKLSQYGVKFCKCVCKGVLDFSRLIWDVTVYNDSRGVARIFGARGKSEIGAPRKKFGGAQKIFARFASKIFDIRGQKFPKSTNLVIILSTMRA